MPERSQLLLGRRSPCPLGRQHGHALGHQQPALGQAMGALERAVHRIAADGVELELFGHDRQLVGVGRDGGKIGIGPTEANRHVVPLRGQGLHVLDLGAGRAAAVVAHAKKAHDVIQFSRFGCQGQVDMLGLVHRRAWCRPRRCGR